MITSYNHPEVGEVRLPGNPIKFEGVRKIESTPAPLLGEHTDQILRSWLNFDQIEIDELRDKDVVA
jgi:crotonobetainyl-CoA:carnitine CoA-transferase CaiB-like acyl-CoA transferase